MQIIGTILVFVAGLFLGALTMAMIQAGAGADRKIREME